MKGIDSMRTVLRRAAAVLAVILLTALLAAFFYRHELLRLRAAMTLFAPAHIVENFRSMDMLFGGSVVRHGGDTWLLPPGTPLGLPETFDFGGTTLDTEDFLNYTGTTGLIVLHDGRVVFERYSLGETPETRHISWSVAKSFTSALIGIALEAGQIESIDDPVTKYAPILAESGYDGVSLKDVLQMASGIGFNEDYGDFRSDINRMGRMIALNTPIDSFVLSLKNEVPPGTEHHYVSMDTQVLGMVLRGATGQSITALLEEGIWKPAGMEADAAWMIDKNGMELVFGGLKAVLRDYARFGLLYLREGRRGDVQIVPAAWVRESTTPQGAHVEPGSDISNPDDIGYGYQWWIPARPEGDYLAIGIYDQYIYVSPKHQVVIAKTSANIHYVEDDGISEAQSIALFRRIAAQAAGEG
jgi:CubicO group peptidase (beta-lactamase class C family)